MDSNRPVTKRCSCSIGVNTCPCHNSIELKALKSPPTHLFYLPKADSTIDTSRSKDEVIKEWIAKKDEEKRYKELKEKMVKEERDREYQKKLEMERQNFKKWLVNKKKSEIDAKKKQQKQIHEQELKTLEKERRQQENQVRFHLWLKKKEQLELEKKITEHKEIIKLLEDKQKRNDDNKTAFNVWLKNSKGKPKPIACNKGVPSLFASESITYINPKPWNSSVEINKEFS